MTTKEFVLKHYPKAHCEGKMVTPTEVTYTLTLDDTHSVQSDSDDQAWEVAALYIRTGISTTPPTP